MASSLAPTLIWFRNDLRLQDQEPFYRACRRSASIIPVYCFDPRHFEETVLGFPKTDHFRAQFLLQSIQNLRDQLKDMGSDLLIRVGHPEDIIPKLAEEFQASAVFASQEVTDEELRLENALEERLLKQKVELEFFWTSTLYHLEDLPFPMNNLPDIFTRFRKEVERGVNIRGLFPKPTIQKPLRFENPGDLPSLTDLGLAPPNRDERSVLPFYGGASAAWQRLEDYIWDKECLATYKETRNGLLGADYSSKFSPWLAHGCISPKEIYYQVKEFETNVTKNQSTYWLIFELIWRDYFRFVAKKYGTRLFKKGGIQNKTPHRLYDKPDLFQKWMDGLTGVPFIDANMRELKYTGFMSNRGRQNVASFLVKDLKVNWTWGAMYFESKLMDYDVCSNWGNWNYVAGVGNDPRENRYFNILSQAKRYDPKGAYVKFWLPELRKLPANQVHIPSQLGRTEQERWEMILGADYPFPMVKPEKWMAS